LQAHIQATLTIRIKLPEIQLYQLLKTLVFQLALVQTTPLKKDYF